MLFAILASAGCANRGTSTPMLETPSAAAMEEAASEEANVVGAMAPRFTVQDHDGDFVRLHELRGKWVVLYFYPQDDTPGCICEATEFTHLLVRFREMNAVVLGVSPDSPATHRYFREKYHLKLTLLSDQSRNVMRKYGAWVDQELFGRPSGRVIRSTYMINPDGRIVHYWPEVIPEGHAERVRAKLMEVQRTARAGSL